MRKGLLTVSLLSGAVLLTTLVSAQQPDHFAYAMTDVQQQNGNWVYLRQLNMETGVFSGTLINGIADKQIVFDAATKKQIADFPAAVADKGFPVQPAFSSGVAALAFDSKHGRLYFTPMFIDQLRYIDLKTMQVFYVTNQSLTGKVQKSSDQGNIVTRMVIAADGNGYAMTNDATQLIQFSTGKKSQITDLGALVDDQANKNISIHNSCSSFGGDMVADDDGNLYIFSARNNVFKVNIESRVATYLGAVSGLPNGYTINGAAVDQNNNVVVSSAMESTSLFVLNTKTWAATPLIAGGTVWHSSDLANGNLLVSNKSKSSNVDLISRPAPVDQDNKISIYPNPVTNNQFTVQFNDLAAGNYTLQVTDVMGRQITQKAINISGDNQSQMIKLSSSNAKGIYLVKITDQNSKSVFSTKIVVQ